MTRIPAALLALLLVGSGCAARPAPAPDAPEEAGRKLREAPVVAATPEAPPTTTPRAAVSVPPIAAWPTWHGTWFDVRYPPGFTVRTGAAGCIEGAGCDSAFFRSPGGDVEFYVYSPLWSGDPSVDIAMDPSVERLVDNREQVEGPKTTRWATVAATDGSYTRSTVDIIDDNFGSPLRHAFGITYADAATYAAWREAYLAFKASLVQYAD